MAKTKSASAESLTVSLSAGQPQSSTVTIKSPARVLPANHRPCQPYTSPDKIEHHNVGEAQNAHLRNDEPEFNYHHVAQREHHCKCGNNHIQPRTPQVKIKSASIALSWAATGTLTGRIQGPRRGEATPV